MRGKIKSDRHLPENWKVPVTLCFFEKINKKTMNFNKFILINDK